MPFYLEEATPLIGSEDAYRIALRRARFDPDGSDDAPLGPTDSVSQRKERP